ncbi:hypothetical protein B9W69_19580 [Acinetobacter baumannii]|nr:hypothetical protein B9W69_19580 [Acinetobacter baumannii]
MLIEFLNSLLSSTMVCQNKMRNQYGFDDIQKKIYAIYDAQMHRFLNNESWELTKDEAIELAMYRKKLKSLN